MRPLSWSVRMVCSPRPSLPITIRQPFCAIERGATRRNNLGQQMAVEVGDDLADDLDLDALPAQQPRLRARCRRRRPRDRRRARRGRCARRRAANCRRESSAGRCPRECRRYSPCSVTTTRRLLCLVICISARETKSSASTAIDLVLRDLRRPAPRSAAAAGSPRRRDRSW